METVQQCILYGNDLSVGNVQIRSDLYVSNRQIICIQNTYYFGPTFVLRRVIRIQSTTVCIQIMQTFIL